MPPGPPTALGGYAAPMPDGGGGGGGGGRGRTVVIAATVVALVAAAGGTAYFVASSGGDEPTIIAQPSPSDSGSPSARPSATTSGPMSAADLADVSGAAIWKVEGEGCGVSGWGSGFAIGPNHLVTNRHVVDFDPTPTLVSRDGLTRLSGHVIGWDDQPDIAVIEVDGKFARWLDWSPTAELREGEPLVTLGYPSPGGDFTVTPGTILSFQQDAGIRQAIRTDGAIDKGNSGGPALDNTGRVAGVVTEMAFNDGGFQLVPLIYTYAALGTAVDRILAAPGNVSPDCETAGTYSDVPDWYEGEDFQPGEGPYDYGDDPYLDGLWDACDAGDMQACDDLFRDSPFGSIYEDFGDSCGNRNEPAGWCTTLYGEGIDEPFTYGDDAEFDRLWDLCSDGDMIGCDDLYYGSPVGSEYEYYGSTCGFRFEEEQYGACSDSDAAEGGGADPQVYGDDAYFDGLWDGCEIGAEMATCDQLYFESAVGSEYEDFGATCGWRLETWEWAGRCVEWEAAGYPPA